MNRKSITFPSHEIIKLICTAIIRSHGGGLIIAKIAPPFSDHENDDLDDSY